MVLVVAGIGEYLVFAGGEEDDGSDDGTRRDGRATERTRAYPRVADGLAATGGTDRGGRTG